MSFRIIFITILISVLFLVASPVLAETLYEFNSPAPTGDNAISSTHYWFQSFTPSISHYLSRVELNLKKAGSPVGTLTLSVFAVDANHKPTGSALKSSTYQESAITTSYVWYSFPFSTSYQLLENTEYALVLTSSSALVGGTQVYWGENSGSTYALGIEGQTTNSGVSWSAVTNYDMGFKEYGDTPPVDVYQKYTDEQTGAEFYLYKVLSYGDILIIIFLILMLCLQIFKTLWNFVWKDQKSKL